MLVTFVSVDWFAKSNSFGCRVDMPIAARSSFVMVSSSLFCSALLLLFRFLFSSSCMMLSMLVLLLSLFCSAVSLCSLVDFSMDVDLPSCLLIALSIRFTLSSRVAHSLRLLLILGPVPYPAFRCLFLAVFFFVVRGFVLFCRVKVAGLLYRNRCRFAMSKSPVYRIEIVAGLPCQSRRFAVSESPVVSIPTLRRAHPRRSLLTPCCFHLYLLRVVIFLTLLRSRSCLFFVVFFVS